MAAITTALALGGLALGAVGTAMQFQGQSQAHDAQLQNIALQQQEEQKRQQAMELDATRRTREMVRQGIAARSMSLTAATAQGANLGSAVPGAYGGIQGRTGVNTLGVGQNLQIGRELFGIKAEETANAISGSNASAMAGFGVGLSSLGGGLVKNMGAISRLSDFGSSIFSGQALSGFGTGGLGQQA